jgi:hypothetical protein
MLMYHSCVQVQHLLTAAACRRCNNFANIINDL